MLTGWSASRSADPTARAASSTMSAAGRTPGAATCRRRPAARAKLPKRRSTCSAAKDSSTYSSATREGVWLRGDADDVAADLATACGWLDDLAAFEAVLPEASRATLDRVR